MTNELRYEIKFVLNEEEMNHVICWLKMSSFKKKFPDRIINSLYFDNLKQDSINDNLAGISQRSKIRIRWYSNKQKELLDPKIEVKKKNGRAGYKKKYFFPNLGKLINNEVLFNFSKTIFSIFNNHKNSNHLISNYLIPMLYVKYNRKYYENFDGIRITIDNKISYHNIIQNKKIHSLKPFFINKKIMEVKFSLNKKKQAHRFIKNLNLTPKRYSKYLAGMSIFGRTVYI